jgi:putative PIN family toxin of toxin-antitoxin system
MRVLLDTNVVIAAFAARGLCSEVFEVCLSEHTIVTSLHILEEVKEKLRIKLRLPLHVVDGIISYLTSVSEIVQPTGPFPSVCRDEDDDMVIAAAVEGHACVIITGDNDLLVLKKHGKIKIASPRDFWELLRKGGTGKSTTTA